MEDGIRIGLQAAKKAIELDPANPVAMNWLSNWQWHNREGNASLNTLEELLEILPNSPAVYDYAPHAFTRMGMPRRALRHAYTAQDLNPKSGDALLYIAFGEYYLQNYEKSIPAFEAYLTYKQNLNGDLAGAGADILAYIYYLSGDQEKAWKTLEREPARYWRLITQILIQNGEGNTQKAGQLLQELWAFPEEEIEQTLWSNRDFELGRIYAAKGNKDSAFYYLDAAYDYVLVFTELLWTYPAFKNLHGDPRWQELIDHLGREFNFDYNKYMESQ
jgi:hypothetical protein